MRIGALLLVLHLFLISNAAVGDATGPLRVSSDNPRYFTDGSGKAIYLAGWNIWGDIQDGFGTAWNYGWGNPSDYETRLKLMTDNNLNYIRLWIYDTGLMRNDGWKNEAADDVPLPLPWQRTGPGTALDGKPKFDLTKFDQAYFDRLRSRVRDAGDRGIYTSIMLFLGEAVRRHTTGMFGGGSYNGWVGHPFNKANNVNGIDGDPSGDGKGNEVHTLDIPAVTALQEDYIREVIDATNDLDNVIYEIANESDGTPEWQYHLINFIKSYESGKPKQHPVLMSGNWGITTSDVFASPADAVSPSGHAPNPYGTDPPAADGSKVVVLDTDHIGVHLSSIGDSAVARVWVWKAFTRGHNPSFLVLDPHSGLDETLRVMGHTRTYAEKMNLAAMTPQNGLASTQYCLANPGKEYLVYLPSGGKVSVDLTAAKGVLAVEWFNPSVGKTTRTGTIPGGARRNFTVPFAGDAVLYLVLAEAVN